LYSVATFFYTSQAKPVPGYWNISIGLSKEIKLYEWMQSWRIMVTCVCFLFINLWVFIFLMFCYYFSFDFTICWLLIYKEKQRFIMSQILFVSSYLRINIWGHHLLLNN
jgi:hypothetical protein